MNLKHCLPFREEKCVAEIVQVSSEFIWKSGCERKGAFEFSSSGKRPLLS